MPEFKAGDVIQFHLVHSISEMKGNTHTGVVVGRRRKGELTAMFDIIFRFCGVEVYMTVPENSPMLRSVKVLERG